MSSIVDEVLSLYQGVVTDPSTWSEQSVVDWVDSVGASEEVDRQSAKYLRRVVRVAEKLRLFWSADVRRDDDSIAWQSRVDIALGPRAWRPVLDLATHRLAVAPTEVLFDVVNDLFRVVNNRPWLEDTSYQEWLDDT